MRGAVTRHGFGPIWSPKARFAAWGRSTPFLHAHRENRPIFSNQECPLQPKLDWAYLVPTVPRCISRTPKGHQPCIPRWVLPASNPTCSPQILRSNFCAPSYRARPHLYCPAMAGLRSRRGGEDTIPAKEGSTDASLLIHGSRYWWGFSADGEW